MTFMDMMWGFGILGLFFGLAVFAISIFALVFWILMLVDCAKRKFKQESEQIVWILVIALTGIIGALIYYFVVKSKNKK